MCGKGKASAEGVVKVCIFFDKLLNTSGWRLLPALKPRLWAASSWSPRCHCHLAVTACPAECCVDQAFSLQLILKSAAWQGVKNWSAGASSRKDQTLSRGKPDGRVKSRGSGSAACKKGLPNQ
eukprot:4181374-Pyramimonas_sp.AAC.1